MKLHLFYNNGNSFPISKSLFGEPIEEAEDDKKKKGQTAQELVNAKISHVSYVTEGANKKKFAFIKSLSDSIKHFFGITKGVYTGKELDDQLNSVINLRKSAEDFLEKFGDPDGSLKEAIGELAEGETYLVELTQEVGVNKNEVDHMNSELLKAINKVNESVKEAISSQNERIAKLEETQNTDYLSEWGEEPEFVALIESEDEAAILKQYEYDKIVEITDEDIAADNDNDATKKLKKHDLEFLEKKGFLSYKEYVRNMPEGHTPMSKKSFAEYMTKRKAMGFEVKREKDGRPMYNSSGRPKMAKVKAADDSTNETEKAAPTETTRADVARQGDKGQASGLGGGGEAGDASQGSTGFATKDPGVDAKPKPKANNQDPKLIKPMSKGADDVVVRRLNTTLALFEKVAGSVEKMSQDMEAMRQEIAMLKENGGGTVIEKQQVPTRRQNTNQHASPFPVTKSDSTPKPNQEGFWGGLGGNPTT